jgi:signal transduction histidine kinase
MKYLLAGDIRLRPEPSFPGFQVSYKTKRGMKDRWLSCFLIAFKGRAVGFFGLDIPPSRQLSPHEIHLLGSLGNYLGGAIENTQLIETVRLHRQELSRLTEKLFETQEEERRRIARELHDEAGQALTAINLGLERLEEKVSSSEDGLKQDIEEIRKMVTRTSSEIRRLSYSLHSDLDIEFHMVGFDHRPDVDTETVLYRFSQEALTNTLKHSGAKHFRLSIIKSYPKIIFLAEDDGIGFDGQIRGGDERSLGLLGMRERASLLGGTFQVHGRPGEGARIRIEIPLAEARSNGSAY